MAQSSITSTSMRLSRTGACDGEIAKQRDGPSVERRVPISAGLLGERECHEALADTGGPKHEDIFVLSSDLAVFQPESPKRFARLFAGPKVGGQRRALLITNRKMLQRTDMHD
jgi:hypothetical protein